MIRRDVEFDSERVRCSAWLYLPDGDGPHRCVVMAHGFGATREAGLAAYAERFAEAGFAVLVFDYRNFGASDGAPRQLLDIRAQQIDLQSAFEYMRDLPEIDSGRIALWGTSFGAGHVIEVAGRNRLVAAVIAQAPYMDGLSVARSQALRQNLRLTFAGLRDLSRALLGRPPFCVLIVGPPGALAAMTSPDAEPGYMALFGPDLPPSADWSNAVAARIFLHVPRFRPLLKASRLACPLLVCVCENDVVTPPDTAVKAAERAPSGELKRYPIGHFEIYLGDWFERAVADQIEFLNRTLAVAG